MEIPVWWERQNLELSQSGMARRFYLESQLQLIGSGLLGTVLWEILRPHSGLRGKDSAIDFGQCDSHARHLPFLLLIIQYFHWKCLPRLQYPKSENSGNFSSFKFAFNVREAVFRKDEFPEVKYLLETGSKLDFNFLFCPSNSLYYPQWFSQWNIFNLSHICYIASRKKAEKISTMSGQWAVVPSSGCWPFFTNIKLAYKPPRNNQE